MKAPRAIRALRLTVDHDEGGAEVYAHLKLYREDDGLIWRVGGHLGDECETLPRPSTIADAEADARLVYPLGSPLRPFATWL